MPRVTSRSRACRSASCLRSRCTRPARPRRSTSTRREATAATVAFTISIGMTQQSFTGDGAFELDELPPQHYELSVRGPSFQTRSVEVDVPSGKNADVGTITVAKGRVLAGTVVADGQPVPD